MAKKTAISKVNLDQRALTLKSGQRALVVGISEYPNPADRLPAVANDVLEMAKVLSSKQGAFSASGVTVLADKQASQKKVRAAIQVVFSEATAHDTVFVYLAGHGFVVGDQYFFMAHDTTNEADAVPLSEIKTLFDQTKSRQAFLWLDFCHSGGILARGVKPDDMTAIKREIGVVRGQGKIIVAACTATQSSYESSALGHGLFTHALLKGLKGEAKSAQDEVTALSLFEFIDHQIGSNRQRPMFFGEMTGRIVLAHYPARSVATNEAAKTTAPKVSKPKAVSKKAEIWVMLGECFFLAETVKHGSNNKLEIKATDVTTETAAVFSEFRQKQFGSSRLLPFACNNDAHLVRVNDVESETAGGGQVWSLKLAVEENAFQNSIEMSYSVNGKTYTGSDIARLRAGRVLLNDPEQKGSHQRGFESYDSIFGWIEGSGQYPVKECVIRKVFNDHRNDSNWKFYARLKSVFQLRVAGIVEHISELTLGTIKAGRIAVKFKGQRKSLYGATPEPIEISGTCPLES